MKNLSDQPVYLGAKRYWRTVWNVGRKDGVLVGVVRFGTVGAFRVKFVGDESRIALNTRSSQAGFWEVEHARGCLQ